MDMVITPSSAMNRMRCAGDLSSPLVGCGGEGLSGTRTGSRRGVVSRVPGKRVAEGRVIPADVVVSGELVADVVGVVVTAPGTTAGGGGTRDGIVLGSRGDFGIGVVLGGGRDIGVDDIGADDVGVEDDGLGVDEGDGTSEGSGRVVGNGSGATGVGRTGLGCFARTAIAGTAG